MIDDQAKAKIRGARYARDLVVLEYLVRAGDRVRGPATTDITIRRQPQADGRVRWALYRGGDCLNREGDFEHDSLPSRRTEEYLERCRFDSPEEALRAWLRFINDRLSRGETWW